MSYGPSLPGITRFCTLGSPPVRCHTADPPVETPLKYELVVNLKVAGSAHATSALLVLADEVLQWAQGHAGGLQGHQIAAR
jgi:hypothetical protein